MGELDRHLQQLAVEAQRHPAKSKERQRALARLFRAMQQSGKLAHFRSVCPDMLRSSYEEIYAEALQNLFCYITEHLERYDPKQGEVLQWANGILRWRILDAVNKFGQFFSNLPHNTQIIDLGDLDARIQPITELNPSLAEQVIQVIKEDPEGIFKSTYTGDHPHANFQFIALQRANGQSWEAISQQLGNKIPALSNFYQRSLKKFAPKIREYLSD
jgi:hypothetical protein